MSFLFLSLSLPLSLLSLSLSLFLSLSLSLSLALSCACRGARPEATCRRRRSHWSNGRMRSSCKATRSAFDLRLIYAIGGLKFGSQHKQADRRSARPVHQSRTPHEGCSWHKSYSVGALGGRERALVILPRGMVRLHSHTVIRRHHRSIFFLRRNVCP